MATPFPTVPCIALLSAEGNMQTSVALWHGDGGRRNAAASAGSCRALAYHTTAFIHTLAEFGCPACVALATCATRETAAKLMDEQACAIT